MWERHFGRNQKYTREGEKKRRINTSQIKIFIELYHDDDFEEKMYREKSAKLLRMLPCSFFNLSFNFTRVKSTTEKKKN